MIILCSKCGERFESLIIDQDLAYKDVFNASYRHIKTKHPAMYQEMVKSVAISVAALSGFMHLNEFVVIPEDEKKINDTAVEMQDVVMAALGYDPGEDDDEDEDNDDSDEQLDPTDPIEIEPSDKATEAKKVCDTIEEMWKGV